MNYSGKEIKKEVLNDGEGMYIPSPNAKNYNKIEFSAKAVSFEGDAKLRLGHGKNISWCAAFIEIDSQYVYVYETWDASKLVEKVPHGLSVSDIKVSICVEKGFYAKLCITTASGDFIKDIRWNACKGDVFAEAEGATFSECTLFYYIDGVNKDIWLFGDSYFDGWCKNMVDWGFGSCYLDGRSGQESAGALESLKMDLAYGTPKRIVWFMGMNDPDTETEVNPSWFECYNAVCEICRKNNIELTLATIATVPTRNHGFKNAIVKNSGYKYLDISAELGAEIDSGWKEGLLATDGVHPSLEGAKVIAEFILSALPEIK